MRNPQKIESAFWVTFWVSRDFIPNRFFLPAPDSVGRGKKKTPDISCLGIRDWSERRDLNPRPFAPEPALSCLHCGVFGGIALYLLGFAASASPDAVAALRDVPYTLP